MTDRTRLRDSPWLIVARAAAALAASMGIGRFVYTPILPLMQAHAGLSSSFGATLATANYAGYLVGAALGIVLPALVRSIGVMRISLVALIGTLVLMPCTHDGAIWFALRFIAGVASALVFVIAVSAMLGRLRRHANHLTGWGFGGVGAGIALSGVLVLVAGSWRAAWWSAGAVAAVLTAFAWRLDAEPADVPSAPRQQGEVIRTHRWFSALFASYSLEGVGYIIAGTFLVAAINQNSPDWVGGSAWVLVGLAALPAPALWATLGRTYSRPTLLVVALLLQAVGIALPAIVGGVAPALIAALLFGLTFLGVVSLALALGAHLQFPRAVALLTTGYGIGQIAGPLIVTPLLHNGYRVALLIGAGIVLAAALAGSALRIRFPHRVGTMVEPSRDECSS